MESALKIEAEHMPMLSTFKSEQVSAADEMEADNDALMREFQNVSTPQALRRLSENISLASAAAEEQVPSAAAQLSPNLNQEVPLLPQQPAVAIARRGWTNRSTSWRVWNARSSS